MATAVQGTPSGHLGSDKHPETQLGQTAAPATYLGICPPTCVAKLANYQAPPVAHTAQHSEIWRPTLTAPKASVNG